MRIFQRRLTCVKILQASVADIPVEHATFHLIAAFQTHYFWSDFERIIEEVYRVLKPDGGSCSAKI
ncbi:class I SAM-dependent methyltransferase [Priestia taiwanensis]|uniref:class I SAM-dependent methyltransferase n=1 Tax=Priestia taiwanensis TaxID=1347902 RepID=UPI00166AA88D|nr:class I SAM-dependent methyltransferase [Priestia taiwanensis]